MTFPFSKPPAGTQLNPLHPLSRGLAGFWLMNEGAGSLINDISGNKNHGRLKNMAPNVQGSGWGGSKFGGSLKFDGTDDYVDCGNDASLDITDDAITLSAWINQNSPISGQSIIGKRIAAQGYELSTNVSGNVGFKTYGTSNPEYLTTSNPMTPENWYHVCAVYDGANKFVYVNGNVVGSVAATGSILTSSYKVGIGSRRGDVLAGPFNGSIDDVRIYNRALSAEEVRLSYEQPFCMMMKPRINTLLKMLGSLDKNNQFLLDSLNCKVMQLGNTRINTWNTLGRPTAKRGLIGFNTTTNKIEVYDGSAWKSVSLS